MSDKIQIFKRVSPESQRDDEIEIDLLDLFRLFWRRKRLIISMTMIFGLLGLAYALYLPFIYRAESKILVQQSNSRLAGLMSQFGGMADLIGLPKTATTGQMLIGILQIDSIVDAIIDEYDLMELYSIDIRLKAREAVMENLETEEDSGSGIVSIAYLDKSPEQSAAIVNSFVDKLQKKLLDISITEAQQRKNFFENQLRQAQQELSDAEEAMVSYQQSSGVVEISSQAKAIIDAIANLRSQIAAKNVEISSLRSYARKDNPRLKLAQTQLEAMNRELSRLEEQQKSSSSTRATSSDILTSFGQFPELGIEYQRKFRDLQFANAKYEMMMKQYENARLSEVNDLSTITILDRATPPDYKYKPGRAKITLGIAFLGFFLSVSWVFGKEFLKSLKDQNQDTDSDSDSDSEQDSDSDYDYE